MKDNNILAWAGSGVTIITGALSQDVLQTVLLIIGIISAMFSLFVNIYTWWKRASEDGKITKEEAEELKQIVDDGTKDFKNETKR